MKRAVFLVLTICLFGLPAQAQYGGGTGEPNDPYLIYDANQMNAIGADSNDWDKHFKLMADIDLAGFTGTEFNVIGNTTTKFTGVFDGNSYEISNFTYSSGGSYYIGIFGYVDDPNAEIKDLGLRDPNVDGGTRDYVGSLVGHLRDGSITGCYAEDGSVSGDDYVGGLVGRNLGTVSDCYSTGSVSGDDNVGGLVGYNSSSGTISNCYSTGSVSGTGDYVGGLVGRNSGTVTDSYSTGSVSGDDDVGGLVGYNSSSGTISNCYAAGSVSGDYYVGGLVGFTYGGMITDCYAGGSVSGTSWVGGLVGKMYGGLFYYPTVTTCYATGSVAGDYSVGGLVGYRSGGTVSDSFWDIDTSDQASSAGGTGKTTEEMQMESTFTDAGWDFTTPIWIMCDEPNYPKLWWQKCPMPPIEVSMQFTPQALNPGSKGNWVKAHFVLPEGFGIGDVDANTPATIEPFGIESDYINVFINEDGLVEIEAAFSRAAFCGAVTDNGAVEVTVVGLLTSGQYFYGTDTIKIINNSFEYLSLLSSHWLEADCGGPDWCSGADLDQNTVVDFVDFAMFDGCCIEVVKE